SQVRSRDSGGANPSSYRLGSAGIDDVFIGFGHDPLHGLAGIIIRGQALLHDPRDDPRGQAARLFAAVLPAHAVGHEKKVGGAVDDVAVFVVLPGPLGRVATDTQNGLSHAV